MTDPQQAHDRFTTQVAWAFGSRVALIALGLATTTIIARGLGPAGLGVYAIALLVPSFLALVASVGVAAACVYFVAGDRIPAQAVVENVTAISLIGTAASGVALAFLAVSGWLAKMLPGIEGGATIAAFSILPLQMLRQAYGLVLYGQQRIRRSSVIDIGQAVGLLGLSGAAVAGLGLGVVGALGAYAGSVLIGLVLEARALAETGIRVRPRLKPAVAADLIEYGLRGNVGVVMQFVTYRLDLIIVNVLLGPALAGIYAVASRLAELLWVLPGAIGAVIFPRASAQNAPSLGLVTRRSVLLTAGVGLVSAAFVIMLGNLGIDLLFTSAYGSAYEPLVALLPGAIFIGMASILANNVAGRGHPGLNSAAAAVAMVATVALDLTLIPTYGIVGAAIASSIAYGIYLAGVLVAYLRTSGHGLARSASDRKDPRVASTATLD